MEYIRYDENERVGTVTLDRPQALNALSIDLLKELEEVIDAIDTDKIRCIIITGAGKKAFAAGADIEEMSTMTVNEAREYGIFGNRIFAKIENHPLPVIAAVNGYCLGGGCELSLACDIRICSDNAVFGQPETGLGITPGFGGTQRMARTVGLPMAKQLMFTAKNIKADEALRIGLVNSVYTQDELMDMAYKMAHQIASNAPIAVRACKEAADRGIDLDIAQAVKVESDVFSRCFETHDQTHAMEAFLKKEKFTDFLNR